MTTHRAAPAAGQGNEGQGTKSRGAPDPSPTVGLVCDGFGGCWTTVQEPITLVRHVIEPHDEDDAAARLGWAAGMVHAGADRGTVVAGLTLAAEAAGLSRTRAEAEHAAAGRVPLDVGAAALLDAAAQAALPEVEADRTIRSALRGSAG